MTNNFVKKHIDFFINVIQDFTEDAKTLVIKLSKTYNLEIDDKMPLNTFFTLKNQKQVGLIDENWAYFLHGYECQFKHKNNHIVEVILKFQNEYGALDPVFLSRYINTNPKYLHLDIRIENEFEDGLKIINTLNKCKLLVKIENTGNVIYDSLNNNFLYIEKEFKGLKLNPQLA